MKFGVSINPNLEDSLVVSVIASDFDGDRDFISAPDDGPIINPLSNMDSVAPDSSKTDSSNEYGPDIDLSDTLRPHFDHE